MNTNLGYSVLALVAGMVLLYWHGWRAWLFAWPSSIRIDADIPQETEVPGVLQGLHHALRAAGFTMLGTHFEQPRFGAPVTLYDYAHVNEQLFATTFVSRDGHPLLYLLTPCGNGMVLTANHRRPSREEKGRYLSGHLEGAAPDRLLKVHQRRVSEMGAPAFSATLDARVEVAKAWYAGVGSAEVRSANAVSLLWSLGAAAMIAVSLVRLSK